MPTPAELEAHERNQRQHDKVSAAGRAYADVLASVLDEGAALCVIEGLVTSDGRLVRFEPIEDGVEFLLD